jgi:hypothetical protein
MSKAMFDEGRRAALLVAQLTRQPGGLTLQLISAQWKMEIQSYGDM